MRWCVGFDRGIRAPASRWKVESYAGYAAQRENCEIVRDRLAGR
jgi:hypothetical protein